jgi:hypothetical protein
VRSSAGAGSSRQDGRPLAPRQINVALPTALILDTWVSRAIGSTDRIRISLPHALHMTCSSNMERSPVFAAPNLAVGPRPVCSELLGSCALDART